MDGKTTHGSAPDCAQILYPGPRENDPKYLALEGLVCEILSRSQTTAPTLLKFGYVADNGSCVENALVIITCAPAIIETVTRWIMKHNENPKNIHLYTRAGHGGLVID